MSEPEILSNQSLGFPGEFTLHLIGDFGFEWLGRAIHPDLTTPSHCLFIVDENRILLYHRTFGHGNAGVFRWRQLGTVAWQHSCLPIQSKGVLWKV